MRALYFWLFVSLALTRPTLAQDAAESGTESSLFYRKGVLGSAYRFAEITFNVLTTYHAGSIPHEAVHAGTTYLFGTKIRYWRIGPLIESVESEKEDHERTTADRFFTSMTAPVFTMATLNLPRWIHEPTARTFYDRWCSTFYTVMFFTPWVTTANAWAGWTRGKAGWDFGNAARAVAKTKGGQAAVLGAMTAGLTIFTIYKWDELRRNMAGLAGRDYAANSSTPEAGLRLELRGNGLAMEYLF